MRIVAAGLPERKPLEALAAAAPNAAPLALVPRVLEQRRLEGLDVAPSAEHAAPVAGLGRGGEVAVAEGGDGVAGDAGGEGRVGEVAVHLVGEVGEVAGDGDVVLFWRGRRLGWGRVWVWV